MVRDAFRPGLLALRQMTAPLVAVQAVAALTVIAYYQVPAVQQFSANLARIKLAGGIPFAFAAGAVAGGVLPEIAKILAGKLRKLDRGWLADAATNAIVYGIIGILVDGLYTGQARVFGSGVDLATLVKKNLADMLVFSPIIGIPIPLGLYELRSRLAPRWAGDRVKSWSEFYRDKYAPSLVMSWGFWIPILFCVYALPPNLQFVFAMFAEAAWSLLFVFVATGKHLD